VPITAAALLATYDDQLRPAEWTNLAPGTHAETDGPVVRIVGERRGFVAGPRDLGIGGAELDAVIARQRDFFAGRGEAVEWKTRSHDLPADIPTRLVAAGFVAEDRETVLIGVAEGLAAEPSIPAGVTIRAVTGDTDMRRIAELKSDVLDDDRSWLAAHLIARVGGGRTVVMVAEAADEVVSAAWLDFEPGTEFAGLWGGATHPAWRGRGIYRALVARRAQLAMARGVRYLQVDASEDSRPILQRLGFVAVTTTTPYVWTP
jgi:GNAT superfamily N-acetyltransferase